VRQGRQLVCCQYLALHLFDQYHFSINLRQKHSTKKNPYQGIGRKVDTRGAFTIKGKICAEIVRARRCASIRSRNCTAAFADFHALTTLTVSTTGRGVDAKNVVEVEFVSTEKKDIGANGAGKSNKFMDV
jgi:hypothetical protein